MKNKTLETNASQSIRSDRISESTIARMAGNLLSGIDWRGSENPKLLAESSVEMARWIAAEVVRTRLEGKADGEK